MAEFPATREAALERLTQFISEAPLYGARRNFVDEHNSGVSRLSPYIRRRALFEEEVLDLVLRNHPFPRVEKFVQEVVWRTYWKGWLESRPWVWESYLQDLAGFAVEGALGVAERATLERAQRGRTGLGYFDAWVNELVTTGYLHNHVRMWFASIWIFTLELPWQLGARFFLENLLDGDPAANTLSWRWVAGLQTRGKHYVATPANIRRYTEGRWAPSNSELNPSPAAITHESFVTRPAVSRSTSDAALRTDECALLVHEEDLYLNGELHLDRFHKVVALVPRFDWRQHRAASHVEHFVNALFDDALANAARTTPIERIADADQLVRAVGERPVVCARPHVGFLAARIDALKLALEARGTTIRFVDRHYDSRLFPHAHRGFFPYWQRVRGELQASR